MSGNLNGVDSYCVLLPFLNIPKKISFYYSINNEAYQSTSNHNIFKNTDRMIIKVSQPYNAGVDML